jgi:hypothetical protein
MKYAVWVLVLLLLILHQDNWLWDDATLLFGFMPITLAYHAGISISAGIVWYLATLYCWPPELEHAAGTESNLQAAVETQGDSEL